MPTLRILLLISAAGMVVASTISDPIVSDVALAPLILVTVILAIANLSADLVPPRRRLDVWCSALTIAAPFPFLVLGQPWGPRAAAVALAALQLVPLAAGRGRARQPVAGPRRLLAALVISTALLLVAVVALVWYGATYLLPAPAGAFARNPYLIRLTTTEAAFAWQTTSGQPVRLTLRTPAGGSLAAVRGRFANLRPATRYEWTAEVNGLSAAAGAFRTAPTSTADPIRLVTFGDYGSGNSHEYAVGRLAAAADPSMFLSGGDNAYLLAAPPFLDRAIFDPLHQLLGEAVTVVALGEHDLAWRDGAAVISALHLPGHHYTAQSGPVQIVVLGLQADTSASRYAAATLGRCAAPCPVRFVLVHRPVAADNPIMPLLRRRHVAAILAAHLHRYERHRRAGILQFTVGTGGEGPGSTAFTRPTADAIVSLQAYGFLEIDVHGSTIAYRFVDDRGRTRDAVRERIPS
ncbi:MAG TPA: hypothetical protein VFW18_08465 [Gaiellales bacterium]|nr:hypothetical protein [Gaiellales bacterium]